MDEMNIIQALSHIRKSLGCSWTKAAWELHDAVEAGKIKPNHGSSVTLLRFLDAIIDRQPKRKSEIVEIMDKHDRSILQTRN
jgi:hypothetical protein